MRFLCLRVACADVARGVVGRPFIYGLTIAGQAGVEAVIKAILADFELTLGLAGHRSMADIQGKADEVLVRVTD